MNHLAARPSRRRTTAFALALGSVLAAYVQAAGPRIATVAAKPASPSSVRPAVSPTAPSGLAWTALPALPAPLSGNPIGVPHTADNFVVCAPGQTALRFDLRSHRFGELSGMSLGTTYAATADRLYSLDGRSLVMIDMTTAAVDTRAPAGGEYAPREGATMVVGNGRAVVLNGTSASGPTSARAFDLRDSRWRPFVTEARTVPRVDATATRFAQDGAEVDALVFGGRAREGNDPVGAPYLVSTRELFTRLAPTDDAPTPRFDHAAVWTGTEVVIWGGQGERGAMRNDGARYLPHENLWVPMAASPLSPRRSVSAAASSRGVVFWGGEDALGAPLADGAIYDPRTDRWTSLPASPLTPRAGAAMVVQGSAVYLMGGRARGSALDNGARLVLD